MKFFKHFSASHRGKSLSLLKRKHGMEAVGRYWTLVEICAEKMEKKQEQIFDESDCIFEFERGFLRDTLMTHQFRTLEMFLRSLVDVELISLRCVGDVLEISLPKLLECMDRDFGKSRKIAPRSRSKKENREEEVELEEAQQQKPVQIFAERNMGSRIHALALAPSGYATLEASLKPELHQFSENLRLALAPHFTKNFWPSIQRVVSKIFAAWTSEELFQDWVNQVFATKSYMKIDDGYAREKYFLVALRNEMKQRGFP